MAWTFVRHLGREQDCYGKWWVRSVWIDGLGGEQCERLRFGERAPSDAEVAAALTKAQAALNPAPTLSDEEKVRQDFLSILDRHRATVEADPELARELGMIYGGGETIPIPVEPEPIKEEPIPEEWGRDPRPGEPEPWEEEPIEEEPIPGEEEPLPGGGR
jgi:hypothetical protein